jgi:hypothetical protein
MYPQRGLEMANKRYALTKDLLRDAREKHDTGEECQFAMDNPRGLSVRVRGGEVAYYVQARTRVRGVKSTVVKRRLGAVGDFTFTQVKKIATEAIFAIKNGRDPDAVIETRLMGGDEKSVAVAVDRAEAVKGDARKPAVRARSATVSQGHSGPSVVHAFRAVDGQERSHK